MQSFNYFNMEHTYFLFDANGNFYLEDQFAGDIGFNNWIIRHKFPMSHIVIFTTNPKSEHAFAANRTDAERMAIDYATCGRIEY